MLHYIKMSRFVAARSFLREGKIMSTFVSQLFLRMSETTPEPVDWAWEGLVPRGSLTMVTGDPGIGKSLLTLQVAAMVTRGVKNPGELVPTSPGPDGSVVGDRGNPESNSAAGVAAAQSGLAGSERRGVLVLSAADHPRRTVLPRLIAAGADPSQVFFLNGEVTDNPGDDEAETRPFRLSRDMEKLEACLQELSGQGINVGMIVIDSIDRYLGTDEKKSVRIEVVAQLAELAAGENLAVVVTANTSMKAGSRGGTAVYLELMNIARSVLKVVPDLENMDQRLVLPIKHNLTARPAGVSFTVNDHVVEWGKEPIDLSGEEYQMQARRTEQMALVRDDDQEIQRAVNWIRQELSIEPEPQVLVQHRASQVHLSNGTLRRAYRLLGGKSCRKRTLWLWSLPVEEDEYFSTPTTRCVRVK